MTSNKRLRSPSYPAIGLPEAIQRIQQIFDRENFHAADGDTLAKAIGYSGSNGASDVVLSALKKYGLLEKSGQGAYKLSAIAKDIITHQPGDPEYVKAVTEAAFTPLLFDELCSEFGIAPPPSDNNLRTKLLKREFNPKVVGDVIRAYRETIELVAQQAPQYNGGDSSLDKGERNQEGASKKMNTPNFSPPAMVQAQQVQQPVISQAFGEKVLVYPIGRNLEARVIFNSQDITQEAITKLAALLNLSQDTFPTKLEIEETKSKEAEHFRAAKWVNEDHDLPVKVLGEAGNGSDGRRYMRIAESDSAVPEDELEYTDN